MGSLLSNAGVLGMGQLAFVACQWGILIVLARLGGPDMVGRFALALAITAPIMLLANLGLRPALVTDVRGEHPLRRYLALRVATTLLGLMVVAVAVLALGYDREMAFLIVVVAMAKGFECISDILYGLQQRHEQFARIAISLGARAALGLAGVAGAVSLTGDVVYGAAALALAWGLVLLGYDGPAARPGGTRAGPVRAWLRLAWQVAPLGAAALLITLNTNLPRYVIAERFGATELGRFAAMAYLAAAGGMLINVLGQVWTPRLARAAASAERRRFAKLIGVMLLISVTLGAGALIAAGCCHVWIMTVLYGDGFGTGADLLVWVMAAGLAGYIVSCLGFALTALRRFHVAPLIYGVACVVNVGTALVLLPGHGLGGVIAAWTVSLLVTALLNALIIARDLGVHESVARLRHAWMTAP